MPALRRLQVRVVPGGPRRRWLRREDRAGGVRAVHVGGGRVPTELRRRTKPVPVSHRLIALDYTPPERPTCR